MSCEYCGALIEHGSLVCPRCGSEQRTASPEPARRAAPEVEVRPLGPSCPAHPGLPVLGNCPRCGKAVCFRCAPEAVTDVLTCHDCLGLTAAHRPVPAGALCAAHPTVGASFICARCGSFACSGCRSWGGPEGFCARCQQGIGIKATRGSRFAANLLDNFAVALLPLILAVLFGVLAADLGQERPIFAPLLVLGMLGGFVLSCGAQLWAQVAWGQSLGKRMLGIKVVRVSGAPIELWRLILMRNVLVQLVAQMCGLIGLIDALLIFGDEQRCLHDYLADTIVVVAAGDSPRTR